MKRLILICISLAFIGSVASAQKLYRPAYFVNLDQDTIHGKGKLAANQAFLWFKSADQPEAYQVMPENVKAVHFQTGTHFVPKEIKYIKRKIIGPTKTRKTNEVGLFLLEYVMDGSTDLYLKKHYGYNQFYIESEQHPISELIYSTSTVKEDGPGYDGVSPRFKGILRYYMSDTPKINKHIDKIKKVNPYTLVKLFETYHLLKFGDYDEITYSKKLLGYKSKRK